MNGESWENALINSIPKRKIEGNEEETKENEGMKDKI